MKCASHTPRNLFSTALWIAAILAGCILLAYASQWMTRITHGFTMYYVYSRSIWEGDDLAPLFDPAVFNARVASYGITDVMDYPNNPPTTALALLPIAWLPPVPAKILFTAVSLVLFALSLKILLEIYGVAPGRNLGPALMTLAFVWRPVYDALALGQLYFLILFLVSLSMRGLQKKGSALLSLPIAATILVKGYGLLPAMWLAFTRRWRACLLVFVGIGVVVASASTLFTPEVWSAYYTHVVQTLGTLPPDAHVAYQTINGFVHHLFSYDREWLPHPLISLPAGAVMGISVVLNILMIIQVASNRPSEAPIDTMIWFSAVVAAGVITSPLAEEYHFVLFLPYVFGICSNIFWEYSEQGRLRGAHWVCFLAIAVMAAPLKYKALQFSSFPLILLAYPKLYAGVVMLLLRKNLTNSAGVISRASTVIAG